MINIRKLEAELWESADMLRSGSKLTSNQYCMPVLGLIFLRYAFSRFKLVEQEILANRPMRNGRKLPVEASDFKAKSAIFLPQEAQYDYLVNLPANVASLQLTGLNGNTLGSLGEVVNNAMELIEQQSEQLHGVLPKNYTIFADDLLSELLRIFNNSALSEVGGDIIGRIYEYFLNKFAKNVASDDGVFFTPKSLVKMIVNVLEPKEGILLDPACGSGGMFVQTGDFVEQSGMEANSKMTFYGQEKVEYNAQLCLMNMAVHGLTGVIKSGDEANSFYHDAHNLDGCCDYIMANPPFNVDKVNVENAMNAGRLPFGIPGVDKSGKSFSNANYLWISYFYSYLNENGRAGFVMASSATDSSRKEKDIRQKIVETGHVDVMVSVGNNFFYTLSLPCSLWFFNKGKSENLKDKVLFIDARNYYTVVDRTLNEWSEWQLRNLGAIVWLYRGETENYKRLIQDYWRYFSQIAEKYDNMAWHMENPTFEDVLQVAKSTEAAFTNSLKQHQEALKATKKRKEKAEQKAAVAEIEAQVAELREAVTVAKEAVWLTSKFGNDGVYQDIPGLCRIATIAQIAEKDYSLTPGAYVGVAETEDDGVDFTQRMNEIHMELAKLQTEANQLMTKIQQNWEALK
jgi:type I restriction enzyme M protein